MPAGKRGGIENANGRIRRWLPRKTDLDDLCDQDIQQIAMTNNLTPRKCLGFKIPREAFLKERGKDLHIRFASNRCASELNLPSMDEGSVAGRAYAMRDTTQIEDL